MKITKRLLRRIVNEYSYSSSDWDEGYGEEEEDVEELARYDALNNNMDKTLYRDNPDYRQAYDDMVSSQLDESKIKITRRQIRQIVKEAIDILNSESGELMIFDDAYGGEYDMHVDAPEAAAKDIMKLSLIHI